MVFLGSYANAKGVVAMNIDSVRQQEANQALDTAWKRMQDLIRKSDRDISDENQDRLFAHFKKIAEEEAVYWGGAMFEAYHGSTAGKSNHLRANVSISAYGCGRSGWLNSTSERR